MTSNNEICVPRSVLSFNTLTSWRLQLDLYKVHCRKCAGNSTLYKQIVEQKGIIRFLLSLNKDLDEVRVRVLEIKQFISG